LIDAAAVLLKPKLEAVKCLLPAAAHCHLGNAGWGSMAELAACECTAGKAALVKPLQDKLQDWHWQLHDLG
jgi:hypothetical protein